MFVITAVVLVRLEVVDTTWIAQIMDLLWYDNQTYNSYRAYYVYQSSHVQPLQIIGSDHQETHIRKLKLVQRNVHTWYTIGKSEAVLENNHTYMSITKVHLYGYPFISPGMLRVDWLRDKCEMQ